MSHYGLRTYPSSLNEEVGFSWESICRTNHFFLLLARLPWRYLVLVKLLEARICISRLPCNLFGLGGSKDNFHMLNPLNDLLKSIASVKLCSFCDYAFNLTRSVILGQPGCRKECFGMIHKSANHSESLDRSAI